MSTSKVKTPLDVVNEQVLNDLAGSENSMVSAPGAKVSVDFRPKKLNYDTVTIVGDQFGRGGLVFYQRYSEFTTKFSEISLTEAINIYITSVEDGSLLVRCPVMEDVIDNFHNGKKKTIYWFRGNERISFSYKN